MWSITFDTVTQIVIRTSVIYILLLAGIRLTGKREVAQLTPFDFVLLLVVSNAVQNAMIGPDTSLSGGVVAMTTLLSLNYLVAMLGTLFPPFRRFVDGVPTLLLVNGQIQFHNLKKEQMSVDELMAVLREHEVQRVEDVAQAVIEVDGSVSVLRKEDGDDGKIAETKYVSSHRKHRHHIRKAN